MSKGVVDAYKMQDWMKPTDKTYTNASGVTQKFLGVLTNVPVQVGLFNFHHDIYITHGHQYSILLGTDLMNKLKIDVLSTRNCLLYYDKMLN